MAKYQFRCDMCNAMIEVNRSYNDPNWDTPPLCCQMLMRRDYSAENTGFIPTDGMYAKDSRKK